MSRHLRFLIVGPPLLFACAVIVTQTLPFVWGKENDFITQDTPVGSYLRGKNIAKVHDIVARDRAARRFDEMLLPDTRVFMTDMIGPTNFWKRVNFYNLVYYLFPREVAVSLDGPARQTKDGFLGRTANSPEEIVFYGYNAMANAVSEDLTVVYPQAGLPVRPLVTPSWFDSNFDFWMAFLLPLFTAFLGMLLFRLVFPGPNLQMLFPERMAYGFGLGMMAVTAVTLGVKLCGFHGYCFVFSVAVVGTLIELGRNYKRYWMGAAAWSRAMVWNPVLMGMMVIGLGMFLVLFHLAGITRLSEYDAIMSWALKAKILHLYKGHDLVQWFSNPRLAHAHLDYPPLVPALHAATYDSLGHVDEFVTKFWPTWMVLFMFMAIASQIRDSKSWFYVPQLMLLGILLLPTTVQYAQREGATIPLAFFTVLGCIQCALWLLGKEPARLCLGLALLFGGAMTKFEGVIFLALVLVSVLLLPSRSETMRHLLGSWRVWAFCLAAALPFLWLRAETRVVNFESNWAGHILLHPWTILANWPIIFAMMVARLFVSNAFADWIIDNGHIRWAGHWGGLSSLYDDSSFGLSWLCLAMTIAAWFAFPTRRSAILWIIAMLIGAAAVLGAISAGFVLTNSAEQLVNSHTPTQQYYIPMLESTPRYFFPTLMAWFGTMFTLTFTDDWNVAERKRGIEVGDLSIPV